MTAGNTNPMKSTPTFRHLFQYTLLSGVILFQACGEPVENDGEMAQAHMERSAIYEKQGQYKAAIIEARNVVKKAPNNPQGHLRLAHLLKDIGNARSAIAVLEPIAADANDPAVYLLLAQCYNDAGKYYSAEQALRQYQAAGGGSSAGEYVLTAAQTDVGLGNTDKAQAALTALAKDPQHQFAAQKAQANLAFNRQQFAATATLVQQMLKDHPEDPETLYIASQLAYLENNLDLAESQLSNALIALPQTDFIKPLRAKILSQLSKVLTELGRSTEALVYSRLLASENPELHEAKTKLADALAKLEQGDPDSAEAMLVELNAEYPTFEPGAVYLGILKYQQGNFDQADALLSPSIDPETAPPRLVSAGAMNKLRLNQVDESLSLLEKALTSHPKNESLLSLYGQIAIQQPGKQQAGAMALEKALAMNPDNFKSRILLANYYVGTGKTQRGLAQLEQSLKLAPDNPEVVSNYVNFMLQSGKPEMADTAIRKLLGDTPSDPAALNLAARFSLSQNDTASAKTRFEKVLDINPNNIGARTGLAEIAMTEGRLDDAIRLYAQLMDDKPDDATGYKGLITAYELKQQPAQGLELVKARAKAGEDSTIANTVLAEYYLRKQRFDKAAEYFARADAQAPNAGDIKSLGATLYYEWAKTYLGEQRIDEARQHLLTATRYAPNNPKLMGTLAEVEILGKRYQEAEQLIAEIAENFPDSSQSDLLSGKLMDVRNQSAEALAAFKRGWDKQPSDLAGQLVYRALSRGGQQAAANAFLDQWLSELPRSRAARIHKATQLQVAGNADEARVIYENLLADDPTNLTALNNLAWLYEGIDDQRAAGIARRAYDVAPENAAVLDTYGWFLHLTGNSATAVPVLEKALSKMPDNAEIKAHLAAARQQPQ